MSKSDVTLTERFPVCQVVAHQIDDHEVFRRSFGSSESRAASSSSTISPWRGPFIDRTVMMPSRAGKTVPARRTGA
jgi:hypothetical protein